MAANLLDRIRDRPELAALACLALLVAGLVLSASAYAAVETEKTFVRHPRWGEASSYEYAVPVTRNATLWPIGATLPMGEPAYYRTVTDHIDVNFTWTATPTMEGHAHAEMVLRIRAQAPDGRSYWEVQHKLADAATDEPGAGLSLSGRLLLDDIVAQVERLDEELPRSDGTLNWTVETTVVYALHHGARTESGESVHALPIRVSDPRFHFPLPQELVWDRTHEDVESVVTERQAGLAGVFGSLRALGLMATGAVGLGVVVFARRSDPGRGHDGPDRAFLREHERFRDWVTRSAAPIDPRSLPPTVVDVPSLEDLVRLAAEARTRVLLDPVSRIYYGVLPGLVYRYGRHSLVSLASTPRPRAR